VTFFFDGEQMMGKVDKMMGEYYSEDHVLTFIGPFAPKVPPLDKEHLKGAMGNLMASFPDLTFNFTNVTPKWDGRGFAADIVVMGTHTGKPFSPMPGVLPEIATTGKQVKIGPETFTLYVNSDGKVNKTTIKPLHEGAPAGPPGFYTEIGGVLPPPPLPDALMCAEVKDFADWHAGFIAHADKKTFPMNGTTYTVPMSRGEACDEAKTLVFNDVTDPNKVAIALFSLDFPKFGPVMADPQFVEMSAAAITSQDAPLLMTNPGPDADDAPSMFFYVEVDDPDKWVAGFQAHGTSKSGTWGYEVPLSRGEFCDESKTRAFKCATNPKLVGGYIEKVRMDKLAPLLGDEKMLQLTKDLGEKEGTKVMKVVAPMPPPPEP